MQKGDWVALSDDTANTYAATGGLILVEKPVNQTRALVIGRIVGTPTALKKVPATAAEANTLAERLAGGFYRKARVEIVAFPIGSIKKFTVYSDGSNATVPGGGATLKLSITGTYANHAGISRPQPTKTAGLELYLSIMSRLALMGIHTVSLLLSLVCSLAVT